MEAGFECARKHGGRCCVRAGGGLRAPRLLRTLSALALAGLLGAGCHARGTAVPPPTAVIVEGLLAIAYGDPAPPAQQGSLVAMLTDRSGHSYQVVADTAAGLRPGALAALGSGWVRVTGKLRGDPPVIWASAVERLPQ